MKPSPDLASMAPPEDSVVPLVDFFKNHPATLFLHRGSFWATDLNGWLSVLTLGQLV